MNRLGQVPLSLLATFSADSRVYQAFGHYLAPGAGYLLAVPGRLAYGAREVAVVGCPVPVDELALLLDAPPEGLLEDDQAARLRARVSVLGLDGWVCDALALWPQGRGRVLRATHECGIRFAEVIT